MSSPEQAAEKKDAPAVTPPAEVAEALAAPVEEKEEVKEAAAGDASGDAKDTEPTEKPTETAEPEANADKPIETTEAEAQPEKSDDKDTKKDESADVEMKDAAESAAAEPVAETKEKDAAVEKAKASRRKSSGGSEPKGKKLNRKQSKARILNLDAKPGDQYLVKLKGFPPWPAIICDEDMLPSLIIASRPVTARRADGTYREDFDDGGKRANDRTFPVMYLHTNEFGWVPNSSLQEFSPEQALDAINDKMRKDILSAYELASEGHDLDFFKELLQQFQEEVVAKEEAQKAKKKKVVDDMDIDAVDKTPAKKTKKRKAEDEVVTPQRSDSVKKPKIKLTGSSAKAAANGAATPKTTGQSASKSSSKAKPKKAADKNGSPVPKKPELTEEEKHNRRVKEVYYLRHKLQKGLFPKEQQPKADDMPHMAEFFTRLENFAEIDASILRATRIHKLPKAILRLENIPREEEFTFKSRSTGLLEKWNKMLADSPPAEGTPAGVNGAEAKAGTNGTEKAEAKTTPVEETKDEGKADAEEKTKAGSEESNKVLATVETSA